MSGFHYRICYEMPFTSTYVVVEAVYSFGVSFLHPHARMFLCSHFSRQDGYVFNTSVLCVLLDLSAERNSLTQARCRAKRLVSDLRFRLSFSAFFH
jgi:hypothetical protein